jgi:hypothetical protein
MDFEGWDLVDTAELELVHPVHGHRGEVLVVAGQGSTVWHEAGRKFRKATERLARRYRGDDKIPPDDKEQLTREWVADMLVGWRGLRDKKSGAEVPFSKAAAVELLGHPAILRQVIDFAADLENFMPRSSSD